jgi:hypothetical protein
MTEQEWLSCSNPTLMLHFLRGKASERQLRLFEVACCRRIWQLLSDERSRQAVELAERYADAQATKEELEAAAEAAWSVWELDTERASMEGQWDKDSGSLPYTPSAAAYNVAIPLGWWGGAPAFIAPHEIAREVAADSGAEDDEQCILLRDIFGKPCRPVAADAAWLTWNGGTVIKLAQAIYDDRAFDRLPVLADALEEAGCSDPEILGHCRGPGPHVRGCWVVDLLLAKE